MEATFICDRCYEEYPDSQYNEWEGHSFCPDCFEAATVVCEECGRRLDREDNAGTRAHILCQKCYEEEFTTCSRCGCLLRRDDANELDYEYYCDDCYEDVRPEEYIHGYYYKPEPVFHGEGPRFFGVELEIDEGGEDHEKARDLLAVGNSDLRDHSYCKHDGSLDDGFEIVTHPMSLDYHQKEMPWKELMDEAISLGYRSHQTNTAGLHIHVSREAFGETEEEQDPGHRPDSVLL